LFAALKNSVEIRRLESALAARTLELRSYQAERLPKLDLVAQYGLFSKFNNYEDYFRKFQRHNGQIGVSIQIPLFSGPGTDARIGQASAEMARLRLEIGALRNRLSLDASRGWQEVKKAEARARGGPPGPRRGARPGSGTDGADAGRPGLAKAGGRSPLHGEREVAPFWMLTTESSEPA
jgi:hypothetical protein